LCASGFLPINATSVVHASRARQAVAGEEKTRRFCK